MIDQIKIKNEVINSVIQQVCEKLRKMEINTIGYENGNPYVTPIYRKIIELEAKKIYMTYEAEFVDLLDDKKLQEDVTIKIASYLSDEPDAHGYIGEVTFSSGTAEYLSKLDINSIGKEDKVKNLSESEKVENNLTIRDYFTHLYLNEKKDVDFFLDCLPHELMHSFGFKGGAIFEGVTETLAREIAQKYGIRIAPIAHQDEVKLAQRVEKIIGRDNLTRYSYFPEGNSNSVALSDCVDEYIGTNEHSTLLDYESVDKELFELCKNGSDEKAKVDVKKKLDSMYIQLNLMYDDYVQQNEDRLYELGQRNTSLGEEESKTQQGKLEQVADFQDKELEFLEYVYEEITSIKDNKKGVNEKEHNDIEESEF